MSSPKGQATPSRRISINKMRDSDGELLQSLHQLSISTSPSSVSPIPARSPRSPHPTPGSTSSSYRPAVDRSPSALSVRAASRGPYNGASSSNGRDSRSATPTLLRKASMNSLHSANGVTPLRRSSSANMSPTASRVFSSPDPPRPPPPTANSIARTHFSRELEVLHGEASNRTAETLVILHDSCYGHRFSRPRTSRAALSTIVERPERIKACVLGISAAYVLLGERHAEGEHAIHPSLSPAAIPSIPFRIQKSTRRMSLTSPAVTNVHGTKWMEELKMMCESAEAKLATGGKELQRPEMNRGPDHEQPKKLHEGDLYLCSESLEALEGSLGAVCDAVDAVFAEAGPKRAFVAVRPPGHHCSASYPSGFCWVNNVHVGIMHGILAHSLTHAAIIDFDLHHGDGSQQIAWQHNSRGVGLAKNAAYWKKASIGYFSLHDINSYPCEMGDEEKVKNASLCIDNAHGQHVWNVHLEPWNTEAEFWELYEGKYAVLLEKARKYLKAHTERLRMANQTSKAAIFLSAGFDASEWEGAGMQRHVVNVPTGFYARIARDVTKIAEDEGTSVHGRLISVLEGGYSDRALTSGVLSHISGLAGSEPIQTGDSNGFGSATNQRSGVVSDRRNSLELKTRPHPYDPSWWSPEDLNLLETGVMTSPPQAKAPRSGPLPTYCTPTQSSTAKMVDAARLRRQASMNGLPPPRPPTPPPPEVPWYVAAHGLCAVLTPTDRMTTSCTHEDLSAEATRIRRDRQTALEGTTSESGRSTPVPPPPAHSRMSLRERKPTNYFEADDDFGKNRRKTVAGASATASEKGVSRSNTPQPSDQAASRQGRRASAATTILESFDDAGNYPASLSQRSATSMTERPDTSMSVRTMVDGPLAVKKTRTVKARKESVKVPRLSKTSGLSTKNGPKSKPSNTVEPAQSAQAPAPAAGDGLDKITSGFKKITLVTKQQKEARAKRESTVSPPKPIVADAAEKRIALSPSSPDPISSQQPSPPRNGVSPYNLPQVTPPPKSGENIPTGPLPPPQSANPNVFIQFRPDGPSPDTVVPQEPLTPLHTNTATPSAVKQTGSVINTTPTAEKCVDPATLRSPSPMRRADLPTFTPTSQIPFAPRTPTEESSPVRFLSPKARGERHVNDAIWEVPETPE